MVTDRVHFPEYANSNNRNTTGIDGHIILACIKGVPLACNSFYNPQSEFKNQFRRDAANSFGTVDNPSLWSRYVI